MTYTYFTPDDPALFVVPGYWANMRHRDGKSVSDERRAEVEKAARLGQIKKVGA